MNETRYRYVEQNRLEHRYHYHYTPFEGAEFLAAYRTSRLEWIHALSERLEDGHGSAVAKEIAAVLPQLPLATNPFFQHLLSRCFQSLSAEPSEALFQSERSGDWQPKDTLRDWFEDRQASLQSTSQERSNLDLLIQKFEVSKRLYASYDASNKPLVREYFEPSNYLLLALACLSEYQDHQTLKHLNAALKLLDLLASLPTEELDPALTELCLVAAHVELASLESMILEHEAAA